MAGTYTRRANIYININGKEVKNDISTIRKEMYKLTNEQARMTIGSQEYKQKTAEIKQLKGILQQHRADVDGIKKGWSMQGVADGFNRYFGMITAAMASFAGVALTIKSSVQAFAEFDDKLADVMKTTGLTKDQVKTLNTELEKIDTRTAQTELLDLARVAGKLGITAEEEILGFVRAADKIKVALSEDLGGDVEESINQLGKLVDIFKLKDEFGIEDALIKIGSAINSLGAAGTANEAYMVEFAKRLAGIAPAAGISIEKVLGLAATLDELGQPTEMAGTAISQVITKMFKETAKYAGIAGMSVADFTDLLNTDANEAFIRLLQGAKGSGTGFGELAKNLDALGLDGARSTAVLGALADNIVKLREKQAFSNDEFEKGTSILVEFNTKNQSAQAELEKARKAFTRMQRELGERLSPAYAGVIKKSSTLLKVFGATVEFLFKYGAQLAVVVATITAYTIAVKVSTLWQTRFQSATLLSVAAQKLQALAFNAQFAAISLYNAVIALLTGKLKVAAIQFRAFSAALMANPIGIVVGAFTALAGAMYLYSRRMTEAQKLQKTLNGVNLEAEKNIVEQRLQVEQLLKVAQDDNRSKADRLAAIQKLNEIAPEYYKGITIETINTDAARTATDKYIASLRQKAKAQAANEKLVEIERELLDLQNGEGADPTFMQQLWNGIKTGGNTAAMAMAHYQTTVNNATKKQKELNLQKEKLLEITEKQYDADKNAPGDNTGGQDYAAQIKAKQAEIEQAEKMPAATAAEIAVRNKKIAAIKLEIKALRELSIAETAPKDLIAAKEEELEAAKKMPATTKAEIAARNKKVEAIEREISALKELGTTKQGDSEEKISTEAIKKRVEEIEAANSAELAAINRRHLDGLTSEDQYKSDLLAQELKFLSEKTKVYKVGSKEYEEAVFKTLELLVTEDQRVKDILISEEQQLARARTENITNEFKQREALELQRWADEKQEIEKRLIDKKNLSAAEIAINAAINKTIEEKEAAHQARMKGIKTDSNIADLQNKVTIATPVYSDKASNAQLKNLLDARMQLLTAQYENEMQLAGDNQNAQLAAEQNFYNGMVAIQDEIELKRGEDASFKIAQAEALYQKGLLSEEQYQQRLTQIVEQAENERAEIRRENIEKFRDIAEIGANTVSILMDMELQKAGDNEAKKLEIKKKYADAEFAINAAGIISSTALAIMKTWEGFANMPVVGQILAGIQTAFLAAQGIAQLSRANQARTSIQALAEGKYPVKAADGKTYKTQFNSSLQTGMYGTKPQLAVFNEVPGEPEMVVDGKTTKKIRRKYPEIIERILNIRHNREPKQDTHGNSSQTAALNFAAGKYPSGAAANLKFNRTNVSVNPNAVSVFIDYAMSSDNQHSPAGTQSPTPYSFPSGDMDGIRTDPAVFDKLNEMIDAIAKIKIYTAIEDIKKGDKNFTEIVNTRGL